MAKKIYKIKFDDKEQTEIFTKWFNEFLRDDYGKILKEKKKSVVVAAKDKDEVRDMIVRVERIDSHYGYGYCLGTEDEDYFIKKVADSKEEYKEENSKELAEDEYER